MMNLKNIGNKEFLMMNFEKHWQIKNFLWGIWKTLVGNKEFDHELDNEIGSKNLMMMIIFAIWKIICLQWATLIWWWTWCVRKPQSVLKLVKLLLLLLHTAHTHTHTHTQMHQVNALQLQFRGFFSDDQQSSVASINHQELYSN
jgi:hypothetical protein